LRRRGAEAEISVWKRFASENVPFAHKKASADSFKPLILLKAGNYGFPRIVEYQRVRGRFLSTFIFSARRSWEKPPLLPVKRGEGGAKRRMDAAQDSENYALLETPIPNSAQPLIRPRSARPPSPDFAGGSPRRQFRFIETPAYHSLFQKSI
jgi:hypothetical protein